MPHHEHYQASAGDIIVKKDCVHIEASVRGRLQNKARESGRPFAEILQ